LDQVVAVLPGEYQLGHEPGDDPGLVHLPKSIANRVPATRTARVPTLGRVP
jgi:hypothetical protein